MTVVEQDERCDESPHHRGEGVNVGVDVREQISQMRKTLADLDRDNPATRVVHTGSSESCDSVIDTMKKDLKGAQVRSRVLEATVEEARNKIVELEEQLKQALDKNESLQKRLNSESMSSKMKGGELKAYLESTKLELGDSHERINQLCQKTQAQEAIILQLKINDEAREATLESVKQELDEASERYDQLIQKNEKHEVKVLNLVESIACLEADKNEIEKKRQTATKNLKKATTLYEKDRRAMTHLRDKFIKEVKRWKELNEELYRSNQEKIQEIESIKQERDGLVDSNDEKLSKISQLTEQVFQLETMTSEHVCQLEANNESKERSMEKLSSRNRLLSTKNAELMERISIADASNEKLMDEKDVLTASVESLSKDNAKLRTELQEAKSAHTAQIKNWRDKYETLDQEFNTLQEKHDMLDKSHGKMMVEYDAMQSNKTSLEVELHDLYKEKRKYQQEKEHLIQTIDESKERCITLETQLDHNKEHFGKRISELIACYDEAMVTNKSLQTELAAQRKYNSEQVTRFMEFEIARQAKAVNSIEEQYKVGEEELKMLALPEIESKISQGTSEINEKLAIIERMHKSVDEAEREVKETLSKRDTIRGKSNDEDTYIFSGLSTEDKSHDEDDESAASMSTASSGHDSRTYEDESLISAEHSLLSAEHEPDAWFWAWTMPKEE